MNVTLSIDLVVPEERLFLLSLDELKTLEQRLFEQSQRECYALSQLGAAYLINFNEQRRTVDALRRFAESHPRYQPLFDGQKLYEWLRAHNEQINTGTLHEGTSRSALWTAFSLWSHQRSQPSQLIKL